MTLFALLYNTDVTAYTKFDWLFQASVCVHRLLGHHPAEIPHQFHFIFSSREKKNRAGYLQSRYVCCSKKEEVHFSCTLSAGFLSCPAIESHRGHNLFPFPRCSVFYTSVNLVLFLHSNKNTSGIAHVHEGFCCLLGF